MKGTVSLHSEYLKFVDYDFATGTYPVEIATAKKCFTRNMSAGCELDLAQLCMCQIVSLLELVNKNEPQGVQKISRDEQVLNLENIESR